ncbi:reverse transcriptase domain-containing protein [Tanacetum coccineum]
MGRSGIWVWEALLHNTTAQDTREQPLNVSFEKIALLRVISYFSGTGSRLRPYHFNYPERSLTIEEMLNKFIDEGKREHEEMRAFIYDFQTTNELLFKEMNNSLIELRFGVQELLKVINNVLMIDCDVKGVTTRGGKTTTQDVHDNNTNVLPKEPIVVELKNPVGPNDVLTNDQPQMTSEPIVQPSNKLPSKKKDPGSFTIPCNIGQLHIDNALADLGASISLMPYTMYKKLGLGEPKATRMSLELADRPFLATARVMIDVFNKKITLRVGDDEVIFDVDQSIKRPTTKDDECYGIDDLDDTINEDAQELLTIKEDVKPRLVRLENLDLGTFTEEEITDEFPDEHLMILKAELNSDEPWYADYANYIVGKFVPPNWTPKKRRRFFSQVKNYFWDEPCAFKLYSDNVMRRCVTGNEILEILAHCHSGPTGDIIVRQLLEGKSMNLDSIGRASLKMLMIM